MDDMSCGSLHALDKPMAAVSFRGEIQVFVVNPDANVNPLERPVLRREVASSSLFLSYTPTEVYATPTLIEYLKEQKIGTLISIQTRFPSDLLQKLIQNLDANMQTTVSRYRSLALGPLAAPSVSKQLHQPIMARTAIEKHWMHPLIGLILSEPDHAMVTKGFIPLWAKGLIARIRCTKMDIAVDY